MLLQESRTLILASSSPRRQELIRTLQLPVRIEVSHVDESYAPLTAPDEIVEALALRKAKAIANNHLADSLDGIVIGSDTIVVYDNQILNKPVDDEDAIRMLLMLQGCTHQVFSGVACIDLKTGKQRAQHRMTEVTMRALSVEQISRSIASGEPRDKAAGCDTTMYLGDTGQYRILSESPSGQPEIIVGHTVSQVTFRPMSDEEIKSYVKTGEPLDKAGAYGVQGLGSVFVERIEGDFYSIMGLPLNLLYQILLKFGVSPFKE